MMTAGAARSASEQPLGPDSVVRLRALTVTQQPGCFVVGLPESGRFISVPPIGKTVLDGLAAGRTVAQVTTAVTPAGATQAVDVLTFVRRFEQLGFLDAVDGHRREPSVGTARALPTWPVRLAPLFGRPAAVVAILAAITSATLLGGVPAVRPHPLDVFFLSSPVQSLVVLTLVTYALAALHEFSHVASAAAVGVPARVRVTRRLYFLTFETNLTGLWALPAQRRVGPLLAGMGFDALVLCALLLARAAEVGPQRLLAALVLVEVSALVTQFFVFLRTDVYAVLTALSGCVNLAVTTRLLLRRSLFALSPAQQQQLAAAQPRDVQVAGWYRWVHLLGMLLAAWFFLAFFLPSTWHLLHWLTDTLRTKPGSAAFYQALVFGLVLLSPRLVTLALIVRDVLPGLRQQPEKSGRLSLRSRRDSTACGPNTEATRPAVVDVAATTAPRRGRV